MQRPQLEHIIRAAAGREKDLSFIAGLLRHRLAQTQIIRERLAATPLDAARRQLCLARLQRLAN